MQSDLSCGTRCDVGASYDSCNPTGRVINDLGDVVGNGAVPASHNGISQISTGILNVLEKHAGGKPTEDVTLIVMKNQVYSSF